MNAAHNEPGSVNMEAIAELESAWDDIDDSIDYEDDGGEDVNNNELSNDESASPDSEVNNEASDSDVQDSFESDSESEDQEGREEVKSEDENSEDKEQSEEVKEEVETLESLKEKIDSGEFSLDINGEDVSLKDLKNDYIGQKEISRRFTELDQKNKSYEADVKVVNEYINEFASRMQNGE